MADEHDDQIDEGFEKAGDVAGERFGHEKQIERAVDKAQEATGKKPKRRASGGLALPQPALTLRSSADC